MPANALHITPLLLQRIADGDEAAFASLFKEMVPFLQASVFKTLQSHEGMKEVMQETFIKVWLNRDQLPLLEKPLHWLYRVAANESFTWLRKEATRSRHVNNYIVTQDNVDVTLAAAEELLSLEETRRLVNQAVDQLSPQRRLIYLLSREEGLKTAEIAEKLELSPSHVRNTLTTALQLVREYLAAAGKVIPLVTLFLK